MKSISTLLLITIFALNINAQEKDPTLLTIGGKDVKLSEFSAIFNKNKSDKPSTKEEIDEYLDLYIKFKLKVREAEELGFDTLSKFTNELKGYRKQLAQPYLTDKEVTESLIKEAYDRMKQDVRASHILVRIEQEADSRDTLKAYNKVMSFRRRIVKGESIEKVLEEIKTKEYIAKTSKELPYWNVLAGDIIDGQDLGYFSSMHMVYSFETAAYTTKVGEVSMPIRTKFGYHIIYVIDKRPARSPINVSHIMIKTAEAKDGSDKKKIDEIYAKLKEGESFVTLAKQFSDDKGSAVKGGELPEFNTGKMVSEFEEASYGLKKDGDISEPFKTQYGWHIVTRNELKEIESYDAIYTSLKAKVMRDSRSNKSKISLLSKIKVENGFNETIAERNDFYKLISNEEVTNASWDIKKSAKYNKVMFSLSASDGEVRTYTQQDFAKALVQLKKPNTKKEINARVEIDKLYTKEQDRFILNFKDSRLSKTNKEFKLLMQEYRDGILLFDLTDEKVWSKAVKDSAGLDAFYEANKTNYMWDKRADATLYKCSDDAIASKVTKILKKKAKKGYTNDQILEMVNVDSQLALNIEEGKFSKGDNEKVDKATWEKGAKTSVKVDASTVIVVVNELLNPEPKALTDIKGLITSDYQNHLEKEWVNELKKKYMVNVNQEVLKLVK